MVTSISKQHPKNELEVRSNIVLNYFSKWSKQLISSIRRNDLEEKFAFIDLSAGWGLDPLQQTSIATKILTLAANDQSLKTMLSSLINDKDEATIAHITKGITNINLIETFTFPPLINFSTVDGNVHTALSSIKTLPALALLDFWNYEGIHWKLIKELVHNSNADLLLIFDYQSIYSSINKKKKQDDLLRIFGKSVNEQLKNDFKKRLSPFQKEVLILKAFEKRLKKSMNRTLLLPLQYKFYNNKNKTSHFLFFLTKNKKAYTLMREIFRSESQIIEDGIGNLEYNPNHGPQRKITSQTLFGSMFNLEQELLKTYKSQTLQFIDIYENHHSDKALVKKNYVDALLNLEKKNKITVTRKRHQRMPFTDSTGLNDKVFVSFNK